MPDNISSRAFPDGYTFFKEGEESSEMYIIISGTVKILKRRPDSEEEIELDVVGPGQVIGEMSLISNESRSATAVALGDVEVKVVNQENFILSTAGIPPWSMCLAKVLVQRLKNINKNIGELLFQEEALTPADSNSKSKDIISFRIDTDKFLKDILFLRGHFFKDNIGELQLRIEELVRRKLPLIILDFSNTLDIDTDAVNFIGKEVNRLKGDGINLRIHNVQLIQSKVESNKAFREAIETILPPNETIPTGQYLMHQGDRDDTMFVVENGRFQVLRNVNGEEVPFAEVGTGDVIGELGLISGRERMASVKALEESSIYRIAANEFRENHFNIPQWFLTILNQLVNRICTAGERFDEVVKVEN